MGRVSGSRQRQEAHKLRTCLPPIAYGNTDALSAVMCEQRRPIAPRCRCYPAAIFFAEIPSRFWPRTLLLYK
jgi:hypothetical protein